MLRPCWVNPVVLGISLSACASLQETVIVCAQSPDTTSPIQLIPRTKAERDQKYQTEHRISLIVEATNSSGKPVTGLKAEDFLVLDNQKPQKIARFREVDGKAFKADVHLVVVLDAINDGGSAIGHVKKDFNEFLSQGMGPLPFPLSLVFLSSAEVLETRPSTDRTAIASRLAQLASRRRDPDCIGVSYHRGSSNPGNCFDHFAKSINALRALLGEKQNVRERTILIWTGQGWPLVDLDSGNYRDVLVELNTDLREAQVTLDAISWRAFNVPKKKVLWTVMDTDQETPDEEAREAMRLQVLARQNGGQAFDRVKNFGDAMSACVADAGDFYVLSFDSIPAAAADELHSVKVKVARPGVSVRATASYYAQP